MKRGINNIADVKRGDTNINKVYRGSNLVWERSSKPVFEELYLRVNNTSNRTIRRLNLSDLSVATGGSWPISHTDSTLLLSNAVDDLGNVWSDNNFQMRKWNKDAQLLFGPQDFGRGWGLSTDKNNNLYIATEGYSYSPKFKKLDINGNLLQELLISSARMYDVVVDPDNGDFYITGGRANNFTTYRYSANFNLITSMDHGSESYGITIDQDYVYVAGGNGISQFNKSNGNFVRFYTHGTIMQAVEVDNNFVYGHGNITGSVTTRKWDKNTGQLIWSVNHGSDAIGGRKSFIFVDLDGNVYTAGARSTLGQAGQTRKYDSNGNLLFTNDSGSDNCEGASMYPRPLYRWL